MKNTDSNTPIQFKRRVFPKFFFLLKDGVCPAAKMYTCWTATLPPPPYGIIQTMWVQICGAKFWWGMFHWTVVGPVVKEEVIVKFPIWQDLNSSACLLTLGAFYIGSI